MLQIIEYSLGGGAELPVASVTVPKLPSLEVSQPNTSGVGVSKSRQEKLLPFILEEKQKQGH